MALLINLGWLLCYVVSAYKLTFHSDAAVANLLAQEIYETGRYFPRDWNYVNGDLWVLFMHAWIVPLLPIFRNGYALHAAAGVLGCALILSGTWFVCGLMAMSLRARLVALILLSAGFTANMSENLFGQQAYGTMFYMGCFLLACAWRVMHSQGRAQLLWGGTTAILLLLVTWANPQRAAVYYLLPVVAASFATYFWSARTEAQARASIIAPSAILVLTLACGALGAVLNAYSLDQGHSTLGAAPINWLSFDGMLRNSTGALRGLLSLIGGLPAPGTPVASAGGVVDALRLLSAAALLWLAPWAVLRNSFAGHPGRLFFAVATLTSIATSLFIFVTTTVAHDQPEASVRYVVPGLMGAILILVAVVVDDRTASTAKRAVGAIAIVILSFSAPIAFNIHDPVAYLTGGESETRNAKIRLARFLQTKGLRYGYATFWNAGQITIFSDSHVKVRQIVFNNGLPAPMRHLSSDRWYEPEAWQGPSFLLLSPEESKLINWDDLAKISGAPTRKLSFETFEIFVFDHNIANDFPTWRLRLRAPAEYPASPLTPHQIGHFTAAPATLSAEKGEAGVLRFGPYQRLVAGHYLVSFDIRTEGANVDDFGLVDVVSNGGQRVLAKRTINHAGVQRVSLPIHFDEFLIDIEFRVISNGAGKFSLSNVELSNDDPK